MFSKVLVANRGEIAARVISTCRELGVTSVAVHSDPDEQALHVRSADEAVSLGGVSAAESYLDIDKIVSAALSVGAEAIHPGYGFLAENAGFARAVEKAGLTFIGPPADAIEVMGEKVAARRVASEADVPQVPGSASAIQSVDEVLAFGEQHGYPVAIKASYGGGGRGMRTVSGPEHAADAFEAAQREAAAAFGRADVYLERYLDNARHVEVQIFADQHGNVVWLGDRDCSVQRRHQKVVEEAPAPGLSPELRTAMGEASTRLARAVDYRGAGTVEFLVEADRGRFYFLEMNTRIQVEHPVTEATLGLDLVAEQLRVAAGEPFALTESGPPPRGHAIEVRLNAEDVAEGAFRPSPGTLSHLSTPHLPGFRFDTGYVAGDEVLPYYDSMIGKLIVWAPTREHAINRMLLAIEHTLVTGVPTTLPAARVVLDHSDFRAARISTLWLESLDLAALLPAPEANEQETSPEFATDDEVDRQEVFVGGRRYVIPLPLSPVAAAAAGSTANETAGPRARRSRANAGGGGSRRGAVGSGQLNSPMQGTVVKLVADVGDEVAEGDIVLVMEAMKMENPVRATVAGTVAAIPVEVGQVVAAGTLVAEITPPPESSD
jgi:acetyl-CoA/propionyl-CoA carboxylase biotin carboxyl carrier protein